MGPACRKEAALHKNVRILNCALFQPYTGVRMYYTRTYESKFITGAIAGAMADENEIGYVASYPIFGTPASVNAFALGAKMTNPRARIKLRWSCLPGDPVQRLLEEGVTVISNREAHASGLAKGSFELGTFMRSGADLVPLAMPCWNWGRMYEKIIQSIFSGAWNEISASKAINYWWGMASGVIDVQWSDQLPSGVQGLGEILKSGITRGTVAPFRMRITDQNGILRNDGSNDLTPEEILTMDWFCDNVEGQIPEFDQLRPVSRETVRALGLYRQSLPQLAPETEEKQL
jgi:basic membrane lipoprotein Med (substrate-binding protein (PBP1-ABC) superfamily)